MAMDFMINAQSSQAANLVAGGVATASGSLSGALMGQAAVMVESPMSLLAEAAEELTFAVDTTDEFELDERKEKTKAEDAAAERLKLYKDLMHEAGKSQKMDQLKDSLRTREGRDHALREALRHFPDFSDAWAALSDALETLEQDSTVSREVVADIRSALAELEDTQGPAIRAGVQGALGAAGYADLGSPDVLRGLYRQTVCDFGSVNDVFAHIHAQYGHVGFDKAMDFLFGTLSADLACDVPSMETTHLENVHANLGQVRLLQSAHMQCEKLLDRWENVHGVKVGGDAELTSMKLLGKVVGLRNETFLGAMHIEEIAATAKAPDIEHEVLFLQELLTMTRSFPPLLFDGDQGRMKVIGAVQEAVDRAIDREDAFLAAQE